MKNQRGFTLIELAVVASIVAILLGFITISLAHSHRNASFNAVQEILLSDLKQQQLKSMIGDTEGREDSDYYGIHFDSNRYVLFHGSTYSPEDTSNSVIDLDSSIRFGNPNFDVVFSKLSGEISAPLVIELQGSDGSNIRRIYLNKYGTVNRVE